MSNQRVSVPTDDLTIGMYIAELDRPWLETPFLFQGFHIESDKEIAELQQHCDHVYVDIERCVEDALEKLAPSASRADDTGTSGRKKRAGKKDQVAATVRTESADDTFRPMDTAVLRQQIVQAKVTHAQTVSAVNEIFDSVKNGAGMDLQAAEEAIEPMVESVVENEDAMSWLARMKKKDNYTHDHSIASCVWAVIFGKHLGLEKEALQVLGLGALLMDVGKTRIPTELLVKTGELTKRETLLLRKHVDFGREIAARVEGVDARVIQIIESHHERYNGTGYPGGVKGNDIPVFARIAGIVDTYDAMTTFRPYAKPISTYEAMRKLNDLAGLEFQAEMVEQFVQAVGVFPVGTLVELSTGEAGVVVEQNRTRRLRPQIMLLTDEQKNALHNFKTIDLRTVLVDAAGNSLFIQCGLPPGAHGLNPSEYYL
ncbi:MAG: HD-GYP domain-containing protein [Gammaproteobacteria bacterium]